MNKSHHGLCYGLVAVLLASLLALPPVPALVADDNDGIPDQVEAVICGQPTVRGFIAATSGVGHACVEVPGRWDYVPPPVDDVILVVPTNVIPSDDGDDDGLPASVTITGLKVIIRPFSPEHVIIETHSETHPVDANDANKEVPVQSVFVLTVPFLTLQAFGADADNDDVPSSLTVSSQQITFDRTVPSITGPTSGPSVTYPIDEDDADPDVPVISQFGFSIPIPGTNARFGSDSDNDLVPSSVTLDQLAVHVDRTSQTPVTTSNRVDTSPLDSDDTDSGDTVPWPAVDADLDRIPDVVEVILCQHVQISNFPADGRCPADGVGPGDEGTGTNYYAPVNAPNPWNLG